MPTYHYKARDISGKTITGSIEAVDEAALLAQLQAKKQFIVSYAQNEKEQKKFTLKPMALAEFNRQIGTMLGSGITLVRAIEIILRRDISGKERELYEGLYRSLLAGNSLSEALEEAGGCFPPLLINMYKAAEANGTIDQTAMRMAEHYEKEHKLKSKLRSASTYPIILLCLTLGVLVVIFTMVLPSFFTMFGDMELPFMTKVMVGISNALTNYFLYILIGIMVVVFLFSLLLTQHDVKLFLDRLKLKLPVFGKLMRTIYTARFSRTLSSLYSSGLTILTALQVSRGTVGNLYIAQQFDTVIREVRNGSSLSAALEQVDGYDKKLPSTVLIGEESGQLEKMLLSVSDSFDYEADQATQRLTTLLEPVLLILMAVVIGTVMISVILPIYQMYGNMGL